MVIPDLVCRICKSDNIRFIMNDTKTTIVKDGYFSIKEVVIPLLCYVCDNCYYRWTKG